MKHIRSPSDRNLIGIRTSHVTPVSHMLLYIFLPVEMDFFVALYGHFLCTNVTYRLLYTY